MVLLLPQQRLITICLDRFPVLHSYLVELIDLLFNRHSGCSFDEIHWSAIHHGVYHCFLESVYSLCCNVQDYARALNSTPFGCLMSSLMQSEGKWFIFIMSSEIVF